MDDLSLEFVGQDVPTTNNLKQPHPPKPGAKPLETDGWPESPVNPDFEAERR
jgi:hypothetical protein